MDAGVALGGGALLGVAFLAGQSGSVSSGIQELKTDLKYLKTDFSKDLKDMKTDFSKDFKDMKTDFNELKSMQQNMDLKLNLLSIGGIGVLTLGGWFVSSPAFTKLGKFIFSAVTSSHE